MEIWKPIEDLPGYSVSNKGRVRKDSTGQIMVLSKNGGYCRITISKHVHRLVANAFLEKPEDESKCWVDHIDGNRSNNDVSNLRWVTPSENAMSFGYNSKSKTKSELFEQLISMAEQSCLNPDKLRLNILNVQTAKFFIIIAIQSEIKKAGFLKKLKI